MEPSARTPNPSSISPTFFLRPAHLSDLPTMAVHNAAAYWDNPLQHHFMYPTASSNPPTYRRIFLQKLRRRFLAPNNLTLVACLASQPTTIVGFAQFSRLGNDPGAGEVLRTKGRLHLTILYILSCYFKIYDFLTNLIWPDHITNHANVAQAEIWFTKDEERYWSPQKHPNRKNRWQANSVVVDPEWQRNGVGKLLMSEIVRWAQRDRVVVGLVSSPAGEGLYRSFGFEMLGDFYKRIGDEVGGGIMIWYPEGWERDENAISG